MDYILKNCRKNKKYNKRWCIVKCQIIFHYLFNKCDKSNNDKGWAIIGSHHLKETNCWFPKHEWPLHFFFLSE